MPFREPTLIVITVAPQLLIGRYEQGKLVQEYSLEGRASEVLVPEVTRLIELHGIKQIIYTHSPGSFMAIKLAYVALRTIEIVWGVKCYGVSAFELNKNHPIKALGALYFVKEKETIITKKLPKQTEPIYQFPKELERISLSESAAPNYLLGAV